MTSITPRNVKTSPNGTRYCRSCGFSDCPSLDGGACPRWAPESGYGSLTLDDLYEMHLQVGEDCRNLHATMMDGMTALISPLSEEWRIRSAACAVLNMIADAIYAEITRRELELVRDPFEPVSPHVHELVPCTCDRRDHKSVCPVGGCWWNA